MRERRAWNREHPTAGKKKRKKRGQQREVYMEKREKQIVRRQLQQQLRVRFGLSLDSNL